MTQPYPPQPGPQWSPQGASAPPSQPRKPRRWPWIVGIIAALLLGIGLGSAGGGSSTPSSPSAAPVSTVTVYANAPADPRDNSPVAAAPAPSASGPRSTFGPGTYEVGTGADQIAPGKYKTPGPESGGSGSCYWARLKNTNGDFDAIITNGNAQGPTTVTISKSDAAFETQCTWTKAG